MPFTPFFTGIPPHVSVLVELETLKQSLNKQKNGILDGIVKELDKRTIGGQEYQTTALLGEIKAYLCEIKKENTAVATNHEALEEEDDNFWTVEVENDPADEAGPTPASTLTLPPPPPGASTSVKPKTGRRLKIYRTSNGRMQLVPPDFAFPALTLSTLVTTWYCGDKSNGIPPYRLLHAWDVAHIKGGKCKLSMMRKLIAAVCRGAGVVNQPELAKTNMNEPQALQLYQLVKHLFQHWKKRQEGMKRCPESYYNILSSRKWRLYGELFATRNF